MTTAAATKITDNNFSAFVLHFVWLERSPSAACRVQSVFVSHYWAFDDVTADFWECHLVCIVNRFWWNIDRVSFASKSAFLKQKQFLFYFCFCLARSNYMRFISSAVFSHALLIHLHRGAPFAASATSHTLATFAEKDFELDLLQPSTPLARQGKVDLPRPWHWKLVWQGW